MSDLHIMCVLSRDFLIWYYEYVWVPSRCCLEVWLVAWLSCTAHKVGVNHLTYTFKTLPFSILNSLSHALSKRAWHIVHLQPGKSGPVFFIFLFFKFIFTGLSGLTDVHATFSLYSLPGIRYVVYDSIWLLLYLTTLWSFPYQKPRSILSILQP